MTRLVPLVEMNITVLGSRFQQPVADLVARLIARPYVKADRGASIHREGGYSASAILLLAAMIESMIQRDRYFLKRHDPTAKACLVAADYLRSNLHYRRHKHVRELFDLRNAIAHNHIWEVEYVQPLTGERKHRKSTLMPETHRLPAVALPRAGARVPRTSIVRFNLLPSRIDRTDLLKALSVSVHLLEFIAKKGTNPVNLARTTVALLNQRLPFSDLVRVLRNAL